MRKAHELRELPLEELETMEREKSEEMLNKKIELSMQQVDNPLKVREMRRELAVLKTVINEKKTAR